MDGNWVARPGLLGRSGNGESGLLAGRSRCAHALCGLAPRWASSLRAGRKVLNEGGADSSQSDAQAVPSLDLLLKGVHNIYHLLTSRNESHEHIAAKAKDWITFLYEAVDVAGLVDMLPIPKEGEDHALRVLTSAVNRAAHKIGESKTISGLSPPLLSSSPRLLLSFYPSLLVFFSPSLPHSVSPHFLLSFSAELISRSAGCPRGQQADPEQVTSRPAENHHPDQDIHGVESEEGECEIGEAGGRQGDERWGWRADEVGIWGGLSGHCVLGREKVRWNGSRRGTRSSGTHWVVEHRLSRCELHGCALRVTIQ